MSLHRRTEPGRDCETANKQTNKRTETDEQALQTSATLKPERTASEFFLSLSTSLPRPPCIVLRHDCRHLARCHNRPLPAVASWLQLRTKPTQHLQSLLAFIGYFLLLLLLLLLLHFSGAAIEMRAHLARRARI